MDHKMRRSDREIDEQAAREILARGEYGVLSTVSEDGQPYGTPVSYALAPGGIVFHSAPDGHKLDNLAANPRVSFCVVGATEVLPNQFATRYESAIVFGRAVELEGEEKLAALSKLIEKYSADFIEKGQMYITHDGGKTRVFRITIDVVSGKARR